MRIVSLLPSATEIVCALGARDELVGRSAECDYPASVLSLPAVMRPRALDGDRPSREIDARVRSVRSTGESLYDLDIELLRSLRPDLLLTQDLCGVCSVTESEVNAACQEAGVEPRILSLTPRTLADVWSTVRQVGAAIERAPPAEAMARGLEERVREARTLATPTPRVAVVEWLDPPILAGLWTPEIVRSAGGSTVGPLPGEPGERTTWTGLAERSPDLVVLSPCSFSVERTRRELGDAELVRSLRAVEPRLGWILADESYFSRPGPRLADGVELVSNCLRQSQVLGPMPVERWSPVSAS